jgi:hypothetical protein
VRELERRFPGGYFEPTPDEGFDKYLEVIDELGAGKADSLRGWREKADIKLGRTKSPTSDATTITQLVTK